MRLLAPRVVEVLRYSEGAGRHRLGQRQWAMMAADAYVYHVRRCRRQPDRALYGGGAASRL